MKTILSLLTICVAIAPGLADDKPQPRDGAAFRQKLLEKFDADKDGKLNEEERAKAKAEYAKRRGAAKGRRGGANTEAAKKRRQEILAKFDKDGDGRLNDEEKAAARKSIAAGRPRPNAAAGKRRKQLIAKFDKDGDGELNDEERAAARKAMAAQFAARRAEMVEKFDKDGDGKLSKEEIAAARKARAGGAGGRPRINRAELRKKFDKDGNGVLDDAERAAAKKHLQELRAKRASAGRDGGPKADASQKRRVNPEALKKFDKDGDGELSPEERKAAIDAACAKKAKK